MSPFLKYVLTLAATSTVAGFAIGFIIGYVNPTAVDGNMPAAMLLAIIAGIVLAVYLAKQFSMTWGKAIGGYFLAGIIGNVGVVLLSALAGGDLIMVEPLTRDELVMAAEALATEAQRLETLAVKPKIKAAFTRPVLIERARECRTLARKMIALSREATA